MRRDKRVERLARWLYQRLQAEYGMQAEACRRAEVGPHYFRQAAERGTIDIHVLFSLEELLGLRADQMLEVARTEEVRG